MQGIPAAIADQMAALGIRWFTTEEAAAARAEGRYPREEMVHPTQEQAHSDQVEHCEILKLTARADRMKGGHSMVLAIGLPREFATTPLKECSPIVLDKIIATQQHKGKYLVVRTVSLPRLEYDMGIRIVAEDINDRAEEIALHYVQLDGMVTGPDLDQLFPLGTVLVIREPTVEKVAQLVSMAYVVHVPTPADYKVVQQNDPVLDGLIWATSSAAVPLPASFDHKAAGNVYYKHRKYVLAVKAYSDGLAKSPSNQEKLLFYRNRAQANLQLENFNAARKDMSAASDLLESVEVPLATVEKVILRRARALEGLRLLEQAKAEYVKLGTVVSDSSEGKEGVKRMKRLLYEVENGIRAAKWEELDKACTDVPMRFQRGFDVGDYSGSVKAVVTPTGKGLVTSGDVVAGEVLLGSEKAVVVGHPGGCGPLNFDRASDCRMGFTFSDQHDALLQSLVDKLLDQGDPSLLSAVSSSLGGGTSYPPLDVPAVSSRGDETKLDPSETNIDIGRLEAVTAFSRFPAPGLTFTETAAQLQAPSADGHFPIASLMLHSCPRRRNLPKGSSVSIAFTDYSLPAAERLEYLRSLFPPAGLCLCELCKADREIDGPERVEQRHKLLGASFSLLKERLKATGNDPHRQAIGRELVVLIRKLDKTYGPGRSSFRPELYEPYALLASTYDPFVHQLKQAEEATLSAMQAAGAESETGKDGRMKVIAAPILVYSKPFEGVLHQAVAMLCTWAAPYRNEKKVVEFLRIHRECIRICDGIESTEHYLERNKDVKHFEELLERRE
ncbi:hypothetical protein JCM8547_005928 [Rhodosporidiobolus lusitaniae]